MSDAIGGWVRAREAEIVDLLCRFVAIDSVTGREGALAAFCDGWLREHGIESILQPAKDRANVVSLVGSGPDALVLSGHLDTVPPVEGAWTHDPWTPVVADGRVVGLGTSDMHASMVGAYFAQLFLVEHAVALPGRLVTAFTIEEETTGDGTRLFLDWCERERFLDFARTACVVTEPTGLESVCLGNKGTVFVHVAIEGKSGHGSRPHQACNPLAAARDVLVALAALERRWADAYADPDLGVATLTPTCVRGGDPSRVNGIPERSELVVDCRLPPALFADGRALFRAELEDALRGAVAEGISLRIEERYPRDGHVLEREQPLARRALAVLRDELGRPSAAFRTTPAGNDAVFFGARGIPTINKLGPGHEDQAHRRDEHVTIENLLLGVELYLRLALRHFGVALAAV